MKIKAKNDCVLVIREIPEAEKSGIAIPDSAKKKAHIGTVATVGSRVEDKSIKEGIKVAFNKTSGFELELDEVVYTVLRGHEIVCEV